MATNNAIVVFSRDELDLIVAFAGCSLDEKPGSNWVQEAGSLPDYVCRIAKAIKKTGKTTSQAIAIAVSRVKKWAAGADGVDADTKAKAAAAVAEWEKLKAKSHAKSGAKKVAASRTDTDMLMLANVSSFNVDQVRAAWDIRTREARKAWFKANPGGSYEDAPTSYSYIKEMWTDYLIVQANDYGKQASLYKVPYAVDAKNDVTFSEPVPVKTEYVTISTDDLAGSEITDSQLQKMTAAVPPCNRTAVDQVLLSISPRPSALEQILKAG